MFRTSAGSLLLAAVALAGCTTNAPTTGLENRPELFPNMGPHRRPITTISPEAQRHFDQGLTWTYAFNHDEAIRSFTRAAEIDPGCAMAWWGVALCHGKQYNHPVMTEARLHGSWDAMQMSLALIDNTTPVERALIEALSTRYAKPWPEDRSHLDRAYADAMADVWARFPNDSDVGTLYAESVMVMNPWDLYTLDQQPREDTSAIVATLQRVLEMDPDNPGALHYYIHVMEPSTDPSQALAAANRLSELVPGSGHLLHMPSHIYVQTGHWEEAVLQNERAVRADARYLMRSPIQLTQQVYQTHNAHMLAYAAMMSGRERDAVRAARTMWDRVTEEGMRAIGPPIDRWMCGTFDVMKRFGRWDDIINEPAPPDYLPITQATWRAARAVAFAAKKDFERARNEHEMFQSAAAAVPEDMLWGRRDLARDVLKVGDHFIRGEIALQQGDYATAATELEQAAAIEDTLSYGEPPQWLQPVRHTLGAVYLADGRHADAERAYREDLKKWPRNGWSLYGLSRALEGQGRTGEAVAVNRQYLEAWANADALTKTSCKCIPDT